MKLSIQPAEKSDLPGILALYAQPDLDDGEMLSHQEAIVLFEKFEQYPNYKLYKALRENQIVGTFALLIMDNLGHLGRPSAIVEDVAVDPAFQRKGIGKKMIQHAMSLSRKAGCYKLVISANQKRNKAHAFYESLGLKRHGYSFVADLDPAV